jgi:hypothetical protein
MALQLRRQFRGKGVKSEDCNLHSLCNEKLISHFTQFVFVFMVELVSVFESPNAFADDGGLISEGTCYVDHWQSVQLLWITSLLAQFL